MTSPRPKILKRRQAYPALSSSPGHRPAMRRLNSSAGVGVAMPLSWKKRVSLMVVDVVMGSEMSEGEGRWGGGARFCGIGGIIIWGIFRSYLEKHGDEFGMENGGVWNSEAWVFWRHATTELWISDCGLLVILDGRAAKRTLDGEIGLEKEAKSRQQYRGSARGLARRHLRQRGSQRARQHHQRWETIAEESAEREREKTVIFRTEAAFGFKLIYIPLHVPCIQKRNCELVFCSQAKFSCRLARFPIPTERCIYKMFSHESIKYIPSSMMGRKKRNTLKQGFDQQASKQD
ncbi:uncharacterized protein MYCFIDRAFT_176892 [Pseudocercospora fijiensis CIRAD86]|uniref:Uncharacterized protein n=1 Tax=Pseudocercospora fijiensis (strain CIRAD86) TaxID=383855 RepID=M2YQ94_PSEFD|nr:uncharacterized protein MYCFIDRAFT_176892 [Pseudocercospora fijiensis CIRAD86]EME79890.1 hypothetical protein MYCFIDRAFT_176892 [Pseudocercospora fijiensis CIRAD86]